MGVKEEMFRNKKIAVIGYGMEGRDVVSFLLSRGAKITVFDKQDIETQKESFEVVSGDNYLSAGLLDFDYVVRSPGVYRFLPEIIEAEKKGVIVTSPIKIFFNECKSTIIGVTGTKGKGTTTTLIKEILQSAGKEVFLVGNIGKPYLEIIPDLKEDSMIVMEMSSFQLIDMDKSPHISIVLNITSDHMDWHKDQEEYVNAKKNIVSHQNEGDYALLNEEYDSSRSFSEYTKGKVVFFSKGKLEEKYKQNLLLRGEHNLENIAAAVGVAKILKISDDLILEVLSKFKGLEHRLELVKSVRGITFYNDSFATGPVATIAAVKSFTEPETLILGGSDKGLDYDDLGVEISNKENVKNIILIGEIRMKIKKSLEKAKFSGKIYDLESSAMDKIVDKALEITPKGGVVILSPSAASFDMFENYKDRGNKYKKAVENLK